MRYDQLLMAKAGEENSMKFWGLFWLLHIALSLNWVFIFSSVSSGFEFIIRKGGFLVRPDQSVWLLRKVRERRKQNKILELTLAIEFSHEG